MQQYKIKTGDLVQLKPEWVKCVRSGRYSPTPTTEIHVVEITLKFGLGDDGQGAIRIEAGSDNDWRWASHFELVGGPW